MPSSMKKNEETSGRRTPTSQRTNDKLMAVRTRRTDENPMAVGIQRTGVRLMAIGTQCTGINLRTRTVRFH